MRFMNDTIKFRANDAMLKEVKRIVNLNPEFYMNTSHFIRVAIMRELRRKFKNKNY